MPTRTSPRHPSFDYRSVAAYFVTTNTHRNRCLFGRVVRGRMHLNQYGRIVAEEWTRSEDLRDTIVLDAFVVMPNHMHGIVCIVPPGVTDVSPRGYVLGDSADFPDPDFSSGDHDRVGDTGLRPCPLPHHRTYGFPYPAVESLALQGHQI